MDVNMRFSHMFPLTLFCVFWVTAVAQGQRPGGREIVKQLDESIREVRSDKTVDARTDAAERLANLAKKMRGMEITDAVVTEITALLDSPDDSVRYWVAMALGNLGPAAKTAAPKLLELLPKADCINGAITSAGGIRYALMKMGIKPPPPPDCGRRIAG